MCGFEQGKKMNLTKNTLGIYFEEGLKMKFFHAGSTSGEGDSELSRFREL